MIPTINRARCHQCSKAAVAGLARLLTPNFEFTLAYIPEQFAALAHSLLSTWCHLQTQCRACSGAATTEANIELLHL